MNSRIYQGTVWHRRALPRRHAFRYRLYMLYLDLAELPALFDGYRLWSARDQVPAPAWFRAADHLGLAAGAEPAALDDAVRRLVAARTGRRPDGPIRLLTQLRCLGYCMNPISLFYCWDRADSRLQAIVAEVSNTPWGEKHCYVLDNTRGPTPGDPALRFTSAKAFHVSPFMGMRQNYRWRFEPPGDELRVRIENVENGRPLFAAGLQLRARPIGAANLNRVLCRHPFMTGKIVTAIYWQALRLWLKRTPLFDHPNNHPEKGTSTR